MRRAWPVVVVLVACSSRSAPPPPATANAPEPSVRDAQAQAIDCDTLREPLERACAAGDIASCVKRGNLETTADGATRWYQPACEHDESACDLDAAATLLGLFEPARPPALARLQRRCTDKHLLACLGLGFALLHGDRAKVAKAARLLETTCKDGQGAACRLFAHDIETTLFGYRDAPITPEEQKILDGKAQIFDRGCMLGDTQSCDHAAHIRGEDKTTPERCGDEIRWMAESPQQP